MDAKKMKALSLINEDAIFNTLIGRMKDSALLGRTSIEQHKFDVEPFEEKLRELGYVIKKENTSTPDYYLISWDVNNL